MRYLLCLSVLWLTLAVPVRAGERAAILFVNRDGSLLDAPRQHAWEGPALQAMGSTGGLTFEPSASLFDSLSSAALALPIVLLASSDAPHLLKARWLILVTLDNEVELVDVEKGERYALGKVDGTKPQPVMKAVADLVGRRLELLAHEQGEVLGNTDSHLYHLPTVDHTDKRKLISFSNEQAARAAGYRACPICFPAPETDPDADNVGPLMAQVLRLDYPVGRRIDPDLEQVAHRLTAANHLESLLAFHIAASDDVFSISYPGGDTFVSDGLLRILETPDERAAVAAHEMAHVALGHFMTWYVAEEETSAPPAFMQIDRGEYLLRLHRHLLKDGLPAWMEDEADGQAIDYMRRAGFNPSAYGQTLHKIEEATAGRRFKADWTHIHPVSADRWKSIQTWPGRLGEVSDLAHSAAAFDTGLAQAMEAHSVSLATALPATRAFVDVMKAATPPGLPARGEPTLLP